MEAFQFGDIKATSLLFILLYFSLNHFKLFILFHSAQSIVIALKMTVDIVESCNNKFFANTAQGLIFVLDYSKLTGPLIKHPTTTTDVEFEFSFACHQFYY